MGTTSDYPMRWITLPWKVIGDTPAVTLLIPVEHSGKTITEAI